MYRRGGSGDIMDPTNTSTTPTETKIPNAYYDGMESTDVVYWPNIGQFQAIHMQLYN
jgi:hypothetical protein